MAVSAAWYGLGLKNQWFTTAGNRIDWMTDTIKCSLHLVGYVPNQDTDDFWNDATNETTGTNYVAGGYTFGTKSLVYDTATNEIRLDAEDAVWSASTITARIAVVYKSTGTASTSPLMGFVNFGQDVSSNSSTYTIQWDASGVLKVTAA